MFKYNNKDTRTTGKSFLGYNFVLVRCHLSDANSNRLFLHTQPTWMKRILPTGE